MELILASTSPHRRALLERLGLSFRVEAPTIDEEALKAQFVGQEPRLLAARLAEAKAGSIAKRNPGALVIGGDQVVSFEGRILGKPGTTVRAKAQLLSMVGRTHELITALAVRRDRQVYTHLDVSRLRLRSLTAEEVTRYVEADQPLDCAGSYKLEARGIMLFERIVTEDQSAITGIPLIALTSALREFGYAVP
jgi:septum formation protein